MKRIFLKLCFLCIIVAINTSVAFAQSNLEGSLQDGLVAAYDFDTADPQDISGNQNNATTINADYENGSMRFYKGEASYLDLGEELSKQLNGSSAISVSVWFKNEGTPSNSFYMFNMPIDGGKVGVELFMNATSLRVCGRSTPTDSWFNKQYLFSDQGRWYHYVGILDYEQKEIVAYLNGQKLTHTGGTDSVSFSKSKYTVGTPTSNPTISCKNAQCEFNGNLDEVRVYNRRISEDEIKKLFATKEIDTSLNEKDMTSYLKEKIPNAAILNIGCSDAYLNLKRVKIDEENHELAPVLENERTLVPIRFISQGFGAKVTYDEPTSTATIKKGDTTIKVIKDEPYILKNQEKIEIDTSSKIIENRLFLPLRAICEALGKEVIYDNGLIIIDDKINFDYKVENDVDAIKRIQKRLVSQGFVPPARNHMKTAVQIAYSGEIGLYIASPTIIKTSNSTLIAAHDYNGARNPMVEEIYRSTDDGKTWQHISSVKDATWCTLFEHKNDIYLMGTSAVYESVIIRKSSDLGETWTEATDENNGLLLLGGDDKTPPNYHTAPVSVVKHNGRIYRAYENATPSTSVADNHAFVMSADENSDLLKASSWTVSSGIKLDHSLIPAKWGVKGTSAGWLEGNVVVAPNNEIWNVIRMTSQPAVDRGAILKLSEDNKTLYIDKNEHFINMPGASHKFVIRYDEVSKKYIAIVNENTDYDSYNQRNCLTLIYSDDLINWKVAETLIGDDQILSWQESIALTGFQYADFFIDGDKLRMLVRQSYDGAANYHDANRIVYYEILDFRKYIQ